MKAYKTPKTKASVSFTEKKSEFIGHICPVTTEREALSYLEEIRAANRKANHNCYAYILRESGAAKQSDDGEPSGTGGMPILEVLTKAGLVNAICVVTRYFGGVLLGAGGLVRAYSKAAGMAADRAGVRMLHPAHELEITLEYPLYGIVERALVREGVHAEARRFAADVRLTLYVREDIAGAYTAELIELTNDAIIVNHSQTSYFDFG